MRRYTHIYNNLTWEDRKYFGLKCSSLIRIFPWKQPRWILVMNVLIILTPLYISPETNSHVMCMLICLFWHVFAAIWRYLPSVYVAPMAKWFQSQFVKYFLFDYFVISMSMPTTVSFAAHGCEGGGQCLNKLILFLAASGNCPFLYNL